MPRFTILAKGPVGYNTQGFDTCYTQDPVISCLDGVMTINHDSATVVDLAAAANTLPLEAQGVRVLVKQGQVERAFHLVSAKIIHGSLKIKIDASTVAFRALIEQCQQAELSQESTETVSTQSQSSAGLLSPPSSPVTTVDDPTTESLQRQNAGLADADEVVTTSTASLN